MRLSSPFFAASAKKRTGGGSASENPDPSSPKVTCIGQVRVKSKRKKDTQFRSLSRRRSGESSFRKTEHRRHQRWVHLPISACEALRAFNSCLLFPCCRSSSSCGGERDGDGCGAVVARWLVFSAPVREIEAAGGGGDHSAAEEDEEEEEVLGRCSRRHVFEDIEVSNGKIKVKGVEEDEDRGRVSICIPPKNALLLMRFRSDPAKMATVANRCLFECEDDEDEAAEETPDCEGDQKGIFVSIIKSNEEPKMEICEEIQRIDEEDEEEEMESNMTSFEALLHCGENEEKSNSGDTNDVVSSLSVSEEEKEDEPLPECLLLMMCEPKLSMEVSKETWVRSADFIRCVPSRAAAGGGGGCEHHQVTVKRRPSVDSAKPKVGDVSGVADVPAPVRRSERHLAQPPRSSCSLPAASVIERRLLGSGAFALSRCKSEPRTAAAKLMPETCFWKNGGVGGLGVGGGGASGIGV